MTNQHPAAPKKPCGSAVTSSRCWLLDGWGHLKSRLDEALLKKQIPSSYICICLPHCDVNKMFPNLSEEFLPPPPTAICPERTEKCQKHGQPLKEWVTLSYVSAFQRFGRFIWENGEILRWEEGKKPPPQQIESANLHRRSDGTTNENSRSCNSTGVSDVNTKEWLLAKNSC